MSSVLKTFKEYHLVPLRAVSILQVVADHVHHPVVAEVEVQDPEVAEAEVQEAEVAIDRKLYFNNKSKGLV